MMRFFWGFCAFLASQSALADDVLYCNSILISSQQHGVVTAYENESFVLKVMPDKMEVTLVHDQRLQDLNGNEVHLPLLFDDYPIPLDLYGNQTSWWGHSYDSMISYKKGELLYSVFLHTKLQMMSVSAYCQLV